MPMSSTSCKELQKGEYTHTEFRQPIKEVQLSLFLNGHMTKNQVEKMSTNHVTDVALHYTGMIIPMWGHMALGEL